MKVKGMWCIMQEMLIKNGVVVFEEEVKNADILVKDEKIVAIYEPGYAPIDIDTVIDAEGLVVMPGAIDPHQHLGLYNSFEESYEVDTAREAIGGLTSIVEYHRGKGDYFETVRNEIEIGEKYSYVDFGISLGLCAKKHMDELEDYVSKLGITSFKFFFDKQDIAHTFYNITKEEALTLDKADLYYIIKKLAEIDPKLLLCIHCEDPDMFRAFLKERQELYPDSISMVDWDAARPDFAESNCVASSMLINAEIKGNIYIVHTSAKKSVDVYSALSENIDCGEVTMETCPQYLLLDKESSIDAKVNPALRSKKDNEALWEGIRKGIIKTIGTDNVPVTKAQKYTKNGELCKTLWDTWVGFSTPGIAMPVMISEGYLKRNIPLTTIAKVLSTNTAKVFNLPCKGAIKVGYDADFAIIDMNWERTITKELFGCSDFSIYEGMTFKGWPRYTIGRGEIIQKDGEIVAKPGRGKYIKRSI